MFQDIATLIRENALKNGVPYAQLKDFNKVEITFVRMATIVDDDGTAKVTAIREGVPIKVKEEEITTS